LRRNCFSSFQALSLAGSPIAVTIEIVLITAHREMRVSVYSKLTKIATIEVILLITAKGIGWNRR